MRAGKQESMLACALLELVAKRACALYHDHDRVSERACALAAL